ncbi:hypothetical protein TNCV_1445111 [Trichonephila clavipes]|nr:hypothetical protein TNCV_1445111 [Trichonephila clavipes]
MIMANLLNNLSKNARTLTRDTNEHNVNEKSIRANKVDFSHFQAIHGTHYGVQSVDTELLNFLNVLLAFHIGEALYSSRIWSPGGR